MHWVHIFVFPDGNNIEVHNVNILLAYGKNISY